MREPYDADSLFVRGYNVMNERVRYHDADTNHLHVPDVSVDRCKRDLHGSLTECCARRMLRLREELQEPSKGEARVPRSPGL
jgi:hypothetical protein